MARTSTTQIIITVQGDGEDGRYAAPSETNQTAPDGGLRKVDLTATDNTIPIPGGYTGVSIKPPTSSALVKKLKYAGGDTGFEISPSKQSYVALPSGKTSFIINLASGSESIEVHFT